MIELSLIKHKLTWSLILVITLYLGAALVGVFVFWPNKKEVAALQTQVDRMLQDEQGLLRIVEQKSGLEKKKLEVEERLGLLAETVPTQYDLPAVLEALTQLGTYYGVSVNRLSHVPLKLASETSVGAIPLSLDVSGSEAILSYLLQMQQTFPSLKIEEVVLSYQGKGQYGMAIRSELQVFVVDHASLSRWESLSVSGVKSKEVPIIGFSLPFEIVAKFLDNNVRVLGIVNGNGYSQALIAKEGKERWVKVGDRLDEANVSDISPDGVMLNVDGVLLKLTIGG